MDHQLDRPTMLPEEASDGLSVADVEVMRPERRPQLLDETLGRGRRRRFRTEEIRTEIVVDPDHVEPLFGEIAHRLRADEPAGSRDDRCWHTTQATRLSGYPVAPRRQRAGVA